MGVAPIFNHICALSVNALLQKNFDKDQWTKSCATPYMKVFYADADDLTATLVTKAEELYLSTKKVFTVEDEEGEDLCKCDFSLAYGALILLNNATLHMKKGKRYGLCGPNGCGKSTLMKAINNGQVDGFPPPEELRTVYVEHDIQGAVTALSGGWKITRLGESDFDEGGHFAFGRTDQPLGRQKCRLVGRVFDLSNDHFFHDCLARFWFLGQSMYAHHPLRNEKARYVQG